MSKTPRRLTAGDLRGAGRLAVEATIGLTHLVENLHHTIQRRPLPLGAPTTAPTRGITGFVYRSVRGVTRVAGGGVDAVLGLATWALDREPAPSSPQRDAVLAALNGVLGDHLAATGNPLATPMSLRRDGVPLPLEPAALAAALPQATGRVLLLVHGLCMTDRQWQRDGVDHGQALAQASARQGGEAFTPVYLHYATGLPVADNGARLSALLTQLQAAWPVPITELSIVGHSMGGLVARSACDVAEATAAPWRPLLRHLAFLGTPHHGAPLERGGHWVDTLLGKSPYTAAFARLGQLRSAGITDLRHGQVRAEGDAPLPLPAGVACHAVAASLSPTGGGLKQALLGDGLVPLASALGEHADPARRLDFDSADRVVVHGVGHLELLSSPAVSALLEGWLCPEPPRELLRLR